MKVTPLIRVCGVSLHVHAVEETPNIGSNDPPQLVDETPDVGNSQEVCDFLGSSRAVGHSGAVNWEEL